jgi:hypothetical protein
MEMFMYTEKTREILSLEQAQIALIALCKELHLFRDYVSIYKSDIDEEVLDAIDSGVIDAFESLKNSVLGDSYEIINKISELEEKAHSDY